jgi:hypothetical protein
VHPWKIGHCSLEFLQDPSKQVTSSSLHTETVINSLTTQRLGDLSHTPFAQRKGAEGGQVELMQSKILSTQLPVDVHRIGFLEGHFNLELQSSLVLAHVLSKHLIGEVLGQLVKERQNELFSAQDPSAQR